MKTITLIAALLLTACTKATLNDIAQLEVGELCAQNVINAGWIMP